MTHYVLIDQNSGFVWGEVDADDPISACRKVDEEIGGETREYEVDSSAQYTTASGYHVHEATSDWTPVDDGQNQAEIDRVTALPKVAFVTFKTVS